MVITDQKRQELLQQFQLEQDHKLDQAIKEAKMGYQYRFLDHRADWYSERCSDLRQAERERNFMENQ